MGTLRRHTQAVRAAALAALAAVVAGLGALGPHAAQAQQAAGPAIKPRVLVIAFADNEPQYLDMVHGLAEQALLELGLPLVDRSQLMSRFQIEELKKGLYYDLQQHLLSELRTRYGAEVILTVGYSRQYRFTREFMGSPHRFYKTDVRVRAVSADTAAVLYSGGGSTSIQARTDEFEALVAEHARKAGEAILAKWRGGPEGAPRPVQVLARGFDHDNLQRLEGALGRMPGVLQVVRRDYGGPASGEQTALLEVALEVPVEQLAASLRALAEPAVRVVESSADRIVLVLAEQLKIGFVQPREGAVLAGPALTAVVETTGPVVAVTVNGTPASPLGSAEGARRWQARLELGGGTHTLLAAAQDDLGRRAEAQLRVTIDARPPQVRILRPAGGLTSQRQLTVLAQVQDDGPVRAVTLNGKPMQGGGAEGTWQLEVALAEGANRLEVVAVDQAGQTGRAVLELVLDSTPPAVRVLAPQAALINRHEVTFEVEATDAGTGVAEVQLGGRPMALAEGRWRLVHRLAEGDNAVEIVALDRAGNRTALQHRIRVDSRPPKLTATVIAVIEGTVDKQGVTVTCEGREVPVGPDGTFRITIEAPVGGTVTVVAVDAAGNRTEQVYRIGAGGRADPETH
ncbi:MAG: hypothetical protein KatS3mg102_1603 [Planctomycetota bacterium]|nr:MAG: hypothetical protein KatS3mg102_1603 [Planctomycetota bacterium]